MRSIIDDNNSCMPPMWLMPYRLDRVMGIALALIEHVT